MKKFFSILLAAIVLFFVSEKFTHGAWDSNTFPVANQAFNDNGTMSNAPFNVETWINTFCTWGAAIGTCPLFSNQQQQANLQQHSMLAKVSKGIELAYSQPPASTGQYIAYLRNRIGIVEPAYAQQGIGFSGLSPIIDIWRAFRNIAYGFLIVILVAIGFMVMFRWKIDPRTVVSIQSALPRLIVTLILITFSYAIVGLMIDLMYLTIYLSIFALGKAGNPEIVSNFTGGAISNLYGTLYNAGQGAVTDITNFFLGVNPGLVNAISAAIGFGLGGIVAGGIPLGGIIGGGIGAGAGIALPNVLVSVLIGIAMLFLLIRLFLTLLSAWIQVFISLIFGPLQLMLGAIPGVNVFGSWFKNLIANLAAFPITIILILIGSYLTQSGSTGNLWTPPGFGGTPSGQGVAGLIGLGVAMIIPSVINSFKQAIKAVSPIPAGPGAIVAPFGSAMGTGMQFLSMQYYLKNSPLSGALGRIPGVGRMFGGGH